MTQYVEQFVSVKIAKDVEDIDESDDESVEDRKPRKVVKVKAKIVKPKKVSNKIVTKSTGNNEICPLDAYYCKGCKYYTTKLSHFKDHIESLKHSNQVGKEDEIIDYSVFKKTIYVCPTCDNVYGSKQYLQTHQKTCCAETHITK